MSIHASGGMLLLTVPKEDTLIADGTEQSVIETEEGLSYIEGYVDLSNMQAGDTVIIRQYMKIKDGGEWKKYDTATYNGVQVNPLVYITVKSIYRGTKVTLQQTAGVNRNYDYQFIKEG